MGNYQTRSTPLNSPHGKLLHSRNEEMAYLDLKKKIKAKSPSLRYQEMAYLAKAIQPQIEGPKESLLYKRWNTKNFLGKITCSTRAYFISKIHQYIKGKGHHLSYIIANEELTNLIKVGEYCITLMYLENHYYDGKYGVISASSQAKNRAERNALARSLYSHLGVHFSQVKQKKILFYLKRLFRLYYAGCQFDSHFLTYRNFRKDSFGDFTLSREAAYFLELEDLIKIFMSANWAKAKKYPPLVQEDYIRLYLGRTYLINGLFFQTFTELLIDLYGRGGKDFSPLLKFARIYGLVQQLVNDNSDFLPVGYNFRTLCKLPEDTFNDSKRGLMTLPMMCYFNRIKNPLFGLAEHYSGSSDWSWVFSQNRSQEIILKQLIDTGAMGQAMSLVAKIAQYGRHTLDSQDPHASLLLDMFSFAAGNRYYKVYYTMKNAKKAGKTIQNSTLKFNFG